MQQLRILALTDHNTHSDENSIYQLLREMRRHPRCAGIDVASRGIAANHLFFEKMAVKNVYASPVDLNFFYFPDGRCFKKNQKRVGLRDYDAVLMRLPYPIAPGFWQFLTQQFPGTLFINAPAGIEVTGSKAFLVNFPELCTPMQRCTTLEDIFEFKQLFPIILKPVQSYGGQGILKIEKDVVYKAGGGELPFNDFAKSLEGKTFDYLGVKFLKNVDQGDKRIVVCCGEILGGALRTPASGSWVCNISQGGKSSGAEADEHEKRIIETINPILNEHGVVFYGIDTLTGDDGRRVLSEINTLSIGGLPKIAEYSGRPISRQAAELLWGYIYSHIN